MGGAEQPPGSMNILLDEDVPVPLVGLLRHLIPEHNVVRVYDRKWGKKSDTNLYKDAAAAGFQAVLTNDLRQLNDPTICSAIKRSGIHYVKYHISDGLDGLALASASICAAIRPLVSALAALSAQKQQRIVTIAALSSKTRRFTISNPATDPPSPYWP